MLYKMKYQNDISKLTNSDTTSSIIHIQIKFPF